MKKLIINCSNGEIEEVTMSTEEINEIHKPIPIEQLLSEIRIKRNLLLDESDKWLLIDYPRLRTQKEDTEILNYRQALRDLPQTCDPYNPIFPTKPL